jgi:IS5 family transposase
MKRRSAMEPVIGHREAVLRMDRCRLKGEISDRLHAVLCAASYNIRWLLRAMTRQVLTAFLRLLPGSDVAAAVA